MPYMKKQKKSLKKFKGDTLEGSKSESVSIKLELAFLAQHEDALLAASYTRSKPAFSGYNKYGNQRGRGYYRGGSQRGNEQCVSKKINPVGLNGRPMICKSCGSYRHLLDDCPDSWENMAKVNVTEEEENVVLFTGYNKTDILRLGIDARNCAVLDSACSSTVCGESWLKEYMSSLDENIKGRVIQKEGNRVFKFGGGTKLKSKGEFTLPAIMAGKNVQIKTDIVESDIPLLLSRSAMKSAGVKLDLENDKANIFGKDVMLNLTNSGHYCIPISNVDVNIENVCSVKLEEMDGKGKYDTLLKLHRQFAHPSMNKLISLLKDAGIWHIDYTEILQKIEESCHLCKIHMKTPPRPSVALPMASEFNQKVAMDLKKWKDHWILHMIDMWSRYTISVFIERKRPCDVIDALMKNWIAIFRIMQSIMTDNGGEFSSDEMRDITSILNIRVCTTAGESPFQNGLCERVHAVTDMMLLKLQYEHKHTDPQTLLSWANMARNSLQMWNGFSSHQLVFGCYPKLPGVMTDSLPSLEGTTRSEVFASHLNTLHAMRKAYIETEACERIRRALRTKVRAAEQVFENGDKVYYKREGRDRWLGPGKVVFQDGKVIFVRHGGVFVRVSPNRLIKAETENESLNGSEFQDTTKNDGRVHENVKQNNRNKVEKQSVCEYMSSKPSQGEASSPGNDNNLLQRLKKDDIIRYKLDNDWIKGKIIGRAGKSSGLYKHWYNVEDENFELKSIDLEKIPWEKIEQIDVNIVNKDSLCNDEAVHRAKMSELEKLRVFDTYEEIPNNGQNTLSTRWVLTQKDGYVKARLVVRGFEEDSIVQRDSPTVNKGCMRLILAVIALKKWTVKTTDIKSAFLQGKSLDRCIFGPST